MLKSSSPRHSRSFSGATSSSINKRFNPVVACKDLVRLSPDDVANILVKLSEGLVAPVASCKAFERLTQHDAAEALLALTDQEIPGSRSPHEGLKINTKVGPGPSEVNTKEAAVHTDGVMLRGVLPHDCSPQRMYSAFQISLDSGELDVQVGRQYPVRTNSIPGLVTVEEIVYLIRQEKCFMKATLYQQPEHAQTGRVNWKHGEDEMLQFYRTLTIRCRHFANWYDADVIIKGHSLPLARDIITFRFTSASQRYVVLKERSKVVKNFSAFNEMSKLLSTHGISGEGRDIDRKIAEIVKSGACLSESAKSEWTLAPREYRLVDYKTYCYARQSMLGLQSGVAVCESKARKLQLLANVPTTLLFTRNEIFVDDTINKSKRVAFDVVRRCQKRRIPNADRESFSAMDRTDDELFEAETLKHVSDEYERVVLKRKAKKDIHRLSVGPFQFDLLDRENREFYRHKQILNDQAEKMMAQIHGNEYNRFPKRDWDRYYL